MRRRSLKALWVVHTENKVELRRYEPTTERRHGTPVLLTYATVLGPSVLGLHPEYSVVRKFLDAVGSDDVSVIQFPTSLVGPSVAPEAHDEYWPRAREWFAERSSTTGRETP